MKVLMINSVSGYGSTGSICVDIAEELEKQGHECFIAYGQVKKGYPKVYKIGTVLENHLHNIGSRVFGKQGYFTKSGTKKLVKFIKDYDPDIIHLHNLHGNYLNLEILFDFFLKIQKPIVWTLHDCWAFTGKCAHYTNVSCYKWKNECNSCPQVHQYPASLFLDRSKTMFYDKKKWFNYIKKTSIITVSNWLNEQLGESFLKFHKNETIYNWVDHETFTLNFETSFIEGLGLDIKKFTVLLVSASWYSNDNKTDDAINLADKLGSNYQVVLVGNLKIKRNIPKNIITIPYVDGKSELAQLYAFSNVYVHLSTEDTFGLVIAEALSCGTPAIVYNSTACPEIIDESCGFVTEIRNIDQIVDCIDLVQKNGKQFYSDNARKRVVENFDIKRNIRATIDVYKNSLS